MITNAIRKLSETALTILPQAEKKGTSVHHRSGFATFSPKLMHANSSFRVGARSSSYDILDLAFDRLFSANGAQFVSDVAGNVAREAVTTILREYGSADGSGSGSSQGVENVIDKYCKNILCSTQGKRFVSDVLTMMVTQATGVYLDKTLHINTFDQIFDSAVKPQHRPFVEGVCVKMCKAWTHTMLNSPGGEVWKPVVIVDSILKWSIDWLYVFFFTGCTQSSSMQSIGEEGALPSTVSGGSLHAHQYPSNPDARLLYGTGDTLRV